MTRHNDDRFDRFADRYEETVAQSLPVAGGGTRYFADRKTRLLARVTSLSGPQHLLDFGCGVGVLTDSLLECLDNSGRVSLMDISEESIATARRRISDQRADFTCMHEANVPVPDGTFHGSVAACVFHHIAPAERLPWMRELHRASQPGGWVAIFEHNPYNPLTRVAVDRCPFDEGVELLPPRETRQLMQNAGFVDIAVRHYLFVPPLLDWLVPVERLLPWLPFGGQYLVFGRRRR